MSWNHLKKISTYIASERGPSTFLTFISRRCGIGEQFLLVHRGPLVAEVDRHPATRELVLRLASRERVERRV